CSRAAPMAPATASTLPPLGEGKEVLAIASTYSRTDLPVNMGSLLVTKFQHRWTVSSGSLVIMFETAGFFPFFPGNFVAISRNRGTLRLQETGLIDGL